MRSVEKLYEKFQQNKGHFKASTDVGKLYNRMLSLVAQAKKDEQQERILVNQKEIKTIRLLKDAQSEIKRLKESNRTMGLRLEMFDDMKALMNSSPLHPMGGTMEALDSIEQEIDHHLADNYKTQTKEE